MASLCNDLDEAKDILLLFSFHPIPLTFDMYLHETWPITESTWGCFSTPTTWFQPGSLYLSPDFRMWCFGANTRRFNSIALPTARKLLASGVWDWVPQRGGGWGGTKKWPQRQGLHLANLFKILSRGFSKRTWFAGLNDEAINTQHIKLSSMFVLAVISSVMMAGTDLMKQPKYLCTQRKRGRTGWAWQALLANITHISPRTQLFLMLFSWIVQVFLEKKKKGKKNLYEI